MKRKSRFVFATKYSGNICDSGLEEIVFCLFPAIRPISLKEFSVLCRAFCLFDPCFRLIRSNFFPFTDDFLSLFIEF